MRLRDAIFVVVVPQEVLGIHSGLFSARVRMNSEWILVAIASFSAQSSKTIKNNIN